jgi:hypothetical protein
LIKKLFAVAAATGLIISLAGSTPAHNKEKDSQPGQKVERTVAVDPQATITLCVASGTLIVRGWDKSEVRVRSLDAPVLELRRIDKPKEPTTPATRIDVMVLEKTMRVLPPRRDCQAVADVEMEVPAGATVQVQTRDGDINIVGIAAAYAGSQNGDIMIERVTKLVEAGSVGGSISLKDSSGRVNLSSAGGGVEVINVRAASVEDTFEVGTVSGDIQLVRVSNPRVMAKTVNGTLMMSGALVKSGSYAFTNMTGDVVLAMPSDASFERQNLRKTAAGLRLRFEVFERATSRGSTCASGGCRRRTIAETARGQRQTSDQRSQIAGAERKGQTFEDFATGHPWCD